MADKMHLYVWKGDFGLPTLQLENMQALAYCKIANVPVNVTYRKCPVWNCGWKMPVFQHGSVQLFGANEIIKYLRANGYNADAHLTTMQRSEMLAIVNMLEAKVKPAVQFLWWLDVQNFEGLTRKWFWHLMPFPLCYFYVNSCRNRAEASSDSMFLMDDDLEVRKQALYKSCVECFEVVAAKVRDRVFLCGDAVTSADALLFACLAPILKVPFPSDALKRALVQHEDVVHYVDRVAKAFFPGTAYEDRFGLWKQQTDTDTEALSKVNIIMSVAMVSVTMFAYGVSNGIIQIPKALGRFLR